MLPVLPGRQNGRADAISRPARSFRTTRGLLYLGGFFGYGIGPSALYTRTGVGPPRPFRVLTGWQCPFCGGTRLGSAALRGDLRSAFDDNPAVLVGLTVLTVLAILWSVEALGGPAARLPAAWRSRARSVRPLGW